MEELTKMIGRCELQLANGKMDIIKMSINELVKVTRQLAESDNDIEQNIADLQYIVNRMMRDMAYIEDSTKEYIKNKYQL